MAENTGQQSPEFIVEKFARTITPQPVESETRGAGNMVYWGDDNLYPNFLLRMYESVSLHESISNSKRDYLIGEGMVDKVTGKPVTAKIALRDTPAKIAQKVAIDWVLFRAFALAVQYNIFGKPLYIYHVPFNHVRSNRTKTKFWVCDDWAIRSTTQLSYEAYKPGINKGGQTTLYVHSEYVPSANATYPSPAYKSGIISMVIDDLINQFGKNDLEDGFSAAHIISFFKGMPDSESGKLFTEKMKAAYSGTKGAKYIIDFNNPPKDAQTATTVKVETVESPDYSAKLEGIGKKAETGILTSHQATSRILFGVEQSGGLGNGTELEAAYQIFKEVWVKNNRNSVEDGLNTLFLAMGFPEIEFRDKGSILPKQLSDTTKEKVYKINELRAIDGLPADPNGDRYLDLTPKPALNPDGTPVQQPPVKGANFMRDTALGRVLTAEDFENVQNFGTPRSGYFVLDESKTDLSTTEGFRACELQFDDASDIEDYLLKTDIESMTTSELRAAIKKELGISVTTSELNDKIAALKEAGVIGDQPTKDESLVRDVKVMYQYQVRSGFGASLIPGSRSFCVRLIENDRYYTKEDIQQMSAIFGYEVFKYCGGWYFNPTSNEAEKQCRHEWKSVRVIKKDSND